MNCPTCGAGGYSKGTGSGIGTPKDMKDIVKEATGAGRLKSLRPARTRPDAIRKPGLIRGGRYASD